MLSSQIVGIKYVLWRLHCLIFLFAWLSIVHIRRMPIFSHLPGSPTPLRRSGSISMLLISCSLLAHLNMRHVAWLASLIIITTDSKWPSRQLMILRKALVCSFQDEWHLARSILIVQVPLASLGRVVLFSLWNKQKGFKANTCLLWQEASCLLSSFGSKTIDVRTKVIVHFTKQMGTYRAANHTAQKHFRVTEEESSISPQWCSTRSWGRIHMISLTCTKPTFLIPTIQASCLRQRDKDKPCLCINNWHQASDTHHLGQ